MKKNGHAKTNGHAPPSPIPLTCPQKLRTLIKGAEHDVVAKTRRANTLIAEVRLAEAKLLELCATALREANAPNGYGVDTDTWEIRPIPQGSPQGSPQ